MAVTVTSNSETITRPKRGISLEGARTRNGKGGRGPGGPNNGGGPGGSGPGGRGDGWMPERYRIGVLAGMASILMMFTALASAYVIRAGLPGSTDWKAIPVPSFVWLSTVLILASSVTMRLARKTLNKGAEESYRRWLFVTLLLGFGFLASQLMAWRQFVARGLYIASNPHSSFFYVLTGLHAVHLFGGILALSYLMFFVWRKRRASSAGTNVKRRTLTEMVALYWHFMDGLWVFLFLLLFIWR
ncbi:MAG: cytochrome c oxidase subunit 3 [Pyrinomonadaceae bacterium]